MNCHACGFALELPSGERVAFRDECAHCGADLHVCTACAHHDPSAYNRCREASAEPVSERTRANRCEYFRPAANARDASDPSSCDRVSEALGDAESLFRKD